MSRTTKIKFIKDHKMYKKDSVVDMYSDNVEAWVESGYAVKLDESKEEGEPTPKKKRRRK